MNECNGVAAFTVPVMDDEDARAEELREIRQTCVQWIINSVRMVKAYKGNRDFALDCWCLALGKIAWPVVGVRSQSELARRYLKPNGHFMTKASVCKLVNEFQGPQFLNLPPAGGQRGLNGRDSMSTQRRQQLK